MARSGSSTAARPAEYAPAASTLRTSAFAVSIPPGRTKAASPSSTKATAPPSSIPQRCRSAAGRLVCPRRETFAVTTPVMSALYAAQTYKAIGLVFTGFRAQRRLHVHDQRCRPRAHRPVRTGPPPPGRCNGECPCWRVQAHQDCCQMPRNAGCQSDR
jgi:hypothetical protein